MRRDRAILIAGAGPTGLVAALELARRGFSPRIVDDADGSASLAESRALGINARTLTLLSPSNVTEAILGAAQDIARFRIRSPSKLLVEIDTHEVPGRFGALHGLSQGATERLLVEALAQRGIVPEWKTAVVALSGGTERPQVTLRRPDGSEEMLTVDLVIGADGAHSAVRKSLGFGFPGEAMEAYFYLADFRYANRIDPGFAEVTFFNPGVVGRIPVSEDTIRYIATLADFESRIVHPDVIVDKPWVSQFRIHFRHVEPMSKGNVFLAGDAAHIHSPAGARGMNLGIEDACWLAYLIAEGREQEYSALRIPAVKQVLKQTYGLTRMITLKNPLATAIRDVAAPLLLGVGRARHALVKGVAGYDTPRPPWIDWAE